VRPDWRAIARLYTAGAGRHDVSMDSDIARRKQHLPHPYNLDLSNVLRGLNRRTPFGRRRAANHPSTATFLRAAVWLIQRNLGPDGRHDIADPDDPDSLIRPLLSFLSQQAVTKAVRHIPAGFDRTAKVSMLRNRWRRQSDFVADVLRFVLWAWHYPAPHKDEMAGLTGEILHGDDPVPAIHRLCYWDMSRHLDSPMFRLSLVAVAQAEGDPVIREAISERNAENGALWKGFYEQFLNARGLRMRPGVTLDECVSLFAAVADGLAVRALADPGGVIDDDEQRCLLSKAALALIAGCTEPAGRPEGPPLEQAVTTLLKGAST
jgi:hypothetical protein